MTETAGTSAMRSAVRLGTPKAGTALSPNLSARPPNYAFLTPKSVMAKTIAAMAPMKRQNFAVSGV